MNKMIDAAATLQGPADRQLFLRALEATGHAVVITGPQVEPPGPIIQFANAAMAELTGFPIEELVGRSPRMLQGPKTDRAILDELKQALVEGRTYSGEAVNYRKDGSSYIVDWMINPIFDERGTIEAWIATQRDVTVRRQKRMARQESEERLRSIFANAPIGLSVVNPEGRFLRANQELCRILGRSQEEVLRIGVAEVTHPEDLDLSWTAAAQAISTGRAAGLDKRYLRPDGSLVWTNSSVTPLPDADGRSGNLLVVTMDLTERRKAEEALRASEERLRNVFALSTVGVAFWSEDFRLIEVNDAFLRMTGFTRDEALGKAWRDLTPEEFWPATLHAIDEATTRGETTPYEKQALCKDGSRWWGLFASRKVDGEIIEFVIEVSDRRRAEQALRESDERFRQFGAASSDVLWIRDAGTLRFEYASPAFDALYGLPAERVVGSNDLRNWAKLILPADRRIALNAIRRARAGANVTCEFRVRRPSDGQIRWIRDTAFPIQDDHGRWHRIGGISEDATDAKQNSDRLQVLVAELQHRTRNLMGVVQALSQRTLDGSVTLAEFEARFADRLAALARVNGLLSRLEEGDRITFDELIRTEIDSLGGINPVGNGKITLDGPGGVRLRSSTVQTFALAIHELATNAVKYGALSQEKGHLTVRWRLEEDRRNSPMLHVDWLETGVAMPGPGSSPGSGGYGRELIERALPYQLGARTSFELRDDGVRSTIVLPVSMRSSGD